MAEQLGRIDYLILSALNDKNAIKPMTSMTVKELLEDGELGVKRSALLNHLNYLIEQGYVGMGGLIWKAKTYYLTDNGRQLLNLN